MLGVWIRIGSCRRRHGRIDDPMHKTDRRHDLRRSSSMVCSPLHILRTLVSSPPMRWWSTRYLPLRAAIFGKSPVVIATLMAAFHDLVLPKEG